MDWSYDVRIYNIEVRRNAKGKTTSHRVRWTVAGKEFRESFKLWTQADSFRSDLVSAQRKGEAFSATTGRPRTHSGRAKDMTWYDCAVAYVDMKWPTSAATARQTIAEALIRVAPVFFPGGMNGAPSSKEIRSALRQYAYNPPARKNDDEIPADVKDHLRWCERNSASVRSVTDPDVLQRLQGSVTRRLDGKPFAPSVARKTRSVLWNFLDYAVERDLLTANPLAKVKWTEMPKGRRRVSKRAVPNPVQARTLLNAVAEIERSGPRLKAFFGVMYFAALRPEEAAFLQKWNLSLSEPRWNDHKEVHEYGWGELHLSEAAPHAGARWTDAGTPRDRRQLKAREAGESRSVPCPPELTELLHEHMEQFPPGADGLIFTGERGGEVPMITYTRVWRAARRYALTENAQRTPLARRPYDLRHAAVSTWLSAGVEPARVAEWAGHSVDVLYEVYAAFLDGGEVLARQRVQAALGHGD